jgi:CO dehydrogenase maturation factor
MKLAISGKGGVGKTTVAALLARLLAAEGDRVIAVDADPVSSLASALGVEGADQITPVADLKSLIEERTGAKTGTFGSFFKMNPTVNDLPEKLSVVKDGVHLMVMGSVDHGGAGCVCPESVMLKSLVTHLVLGRNEHLIMDMEAGVEHLGRATATAVDAMLTVVEPGARSVAAAKKVKQLADEIKIKRVAAVANKIRGDEDRDAVARALEPLPLLGVIPFDPQVVDADLSGEPPYASPEDIPDAARQLLAALRDYVES